MKWLLTTFLALLLLTALQPWLQKLVIGRLPGDLRFRRNGREIVLPFTSTVLLSLLLTALARVLKAATRAATDPPRRSHWRALRAAAIAQGRQVAWLGLRAALG